MREFISKDRRSVCWSGACLFAALGCLTLATGCGPVSSFEYHEYSHAGNDADTLDPNAESRQTTSKGANASVTDKADVAEAPAVPAPLEEVVASNANGGSKSASSTAPAAAKTSRAESSAPPQNAKPEASTKAETAPVSAQRPGQMAVAQRSQGRPSASAPPVTPRKPEVLIKDKQFKTDETHQALRVSYDDIDLLKVLNMEPVTPEALTLMPDWLKSLDGKRIVLRGYMIPEFSETELPGFAIARDLELCCFGRDPKPYDVFQVKMARGTTTDYIHQRPFDVVGVFHISQDPETWIDGMYSIDDAKVIQR
jgi:hypothetical protein